jgi:hypothetical protein
VTLGLRARDAETLCAAELDLGAHFDVKLEAERLTFLELEVVHVRLARPP